MNKRLVTFFIFLPILSFAQDDGLLGNWRLISVKDKGTSLIDTSFRKESGLRLTFLNDSTYNGRLSVNSFWGTYRSKGSQITMNNGPVTEICCDRGMGLKFQNYLLQSQDYIIKGDSLILANWYRELYLKREE